MTRAQQAQGKVGEQAAMYALAAAGVYAIERVGTPVRLIASRSPGLFKVVFGEPVAGDFRGVGLHGQSVLAEVKTVQHNLRWSDFREHQPGKLTEHDSYGGTSLVVWVHDVIYVMRWRDMVQRGFTFGGSITPDIARAIAITSLA